jgi:D-3-phosphoglycerate dehydrogenase / 2-oxoglutarate reductase
MKILIADKFPKPGISALESLGVSVTYDPDVAAEALASRIGDHEILVVRGKKVSAAVLEAGKALQLVVRAGAGVNTIAVDAASKLGIYVSNCPGKNAIAVAELALGLMVALDRRIPQASAELHAGKWNKKEYSKADGLFGKRLGVVGVGQIGRAVIERALAFGLEVTAWSRSLTDAQAEAMGVGRAASPLELARVSDIVSLHLAYTPDTKGLIGRDFLAALPERAMLVNTSRDGIVDERALLEQMEKRGLRYASDVFDGEPGDGTASFDNALVKHPATVTTPHIGASTEQAQSAVSDEAVRIVREFVKSGHVPNVVNLCAASPARWQLNVRHLDRVGVLASVLGAVREAGINVEELENVIFDKAVAACARIRLANEPTRELVARIGGLENVIDARVVQLA